MKRSWIGFGLLVILLACGLVTTWAMQRCYDPIAAELERAAALAEEDQWTEAENYVNHAAEQWRLGWGFSASLADHAPMERINGLFAQLEVCAATREKGTYRLLCAQLQEELRAMGEAHRITWWNLL